MGFRTLTKARQPRNFPSRIVGGSGKRICASADKTHSQRRSLPLGREFPDDHFWHCKRVWLSNNGTPTIRRTPPDKSSIKPSNLPGIHRGISISHDKSGWRLDFDLAGIQQLLQLHAGSWRLETD